MRLAHGFDDEREAGGTSRGKFRAPVAMLDGDDAGRSVAEGIVERLQRAGLSVGPNRCYGTDAAG